MAAKIVLCEDRMPPEGKIVETITQSGRVGRLKFSGNLWWVPSGEMYVYYAPMAWVEED